VFSLSLSLPLLFPPSPLSLFIPPLPSLATMGWAALLQQTLPTMTLGLALALKQQGQATVD
jgi:hypothetical protein